MDQFKFIFMIFLAAKGMCLKYTEIKLSMDYFYLKNPNFICLLVCDADNWAQNFSKLAFERNVAISVVYMDNIKYSVNKVRSCLRQRYSNIGVLLDLQCANSQDVLYWAAEHFFLSGNHNWLILTTEDEFHKTNNFQNDDSIEKDPQAMNNTKIISYSAITYLSNLAISVDADVVIAIKKDVVIYNLFEISNFGKMQRGIFRTTIIGTWTEVNGLRIPVTYKYQRRWDFQKLPLRVIVVSSRPTHFQPSMLTSRTTTPDVNVITRIASSVLNVIAEQHNIRLNYSVTDRWIGTFHKNSTRVVANSLYFREQDITPLLRMTKELVNKVDFLGQPLCSIETKYYYRIPNYGIGKFENQFLTPLRNESWGCIVATSILCCLILFLAAKFEHHPLSIQYAVFTVIASVCQQFFEDDEGNHIRRASSARKLTVLVTGISCVLLYNYYTSSVVSWLLSGPPPSINSLEELLASPLELIFEDVGYTKSWLQVPGYYYNKRNARIEDALRVKKVFGKKKGAPLLMTTEEGIEMVKAGGYAFHAQVANANTRISHVFDKKELCELGSLSSMEKTALYPSVPKNSPYKEFFEWSFTLLKERGIISCIQRRMGSPDITCDGSVPRALTLGGAAPAFILLAAGYIMAVFILIAERVVHRLVSKSRNDDVTRREFLTADGDSMLQALTSIVLNIVVLIAEHRMKKKRNIEDILFVN